MLGPNGSGKSTVFDCIERIRSFAMGESKVSSLFPSSTLTSWQTVSEQQFTFEIEGNGGQYRYDLELVHSEKRTYSSVSREELFFNGQPLLAFSNATTTLYGENFSQPILTFPADGSLSAVSLVPPSGLYRFITWFKIALSRTAIVQIVPPMMDETSQKELSQPSKYFENFVSWYRWISQNQGVVIRLQQELREVLPRFSHFNLEAIGPEARVLEAVFDESDKSVTFGALSDGQRMLIALYALLFSLKARSETVDGNVYQPASLLCLDEPDNFIAPREIQPWLTAVEDFLLDRPHRLLIISHHPESIDYCLTPSTGEAFSAFWFSREDNKHTRVQLIDPNDLGTLKPSELAARGWLRP